MKNKIIDIIVGARPNFMKVVAGWQYILPVLVGTACFLIANTTNPYLAKFDYIWVVFLPVALINIWLLDKNKIAYIQGKP